MRIDSAERKIRQSVERGEWKPVRRLEDEKKRYSRYATATFRKNRRVNIRIADRDLEAMQKRTIEE